MILPDEIGSQHGHRAELARSVAWDRVAAGLAARCASPPHDLHLAPTARSLLRHAEPVGYTTLRRGDVHDVGSPTAGRRRPTG